MKKINRRDYLLQMGAGAAGLIAASELPLVGQTRRRGTTQRQTQSGRTTATTTESLKWMPTDVPPTLDAFVTAIYAGLSGFAYNDSGFVDVVFHPGTGGHELEIQIYKNPLTTDCEPDKIIKPHRNDRLRFDTSGGPPKVFQADSNYFDRNSTDPKYAYDFRWMPDLHSQDFYYPEAYPLNRVRGTRLAVPTGTFYTRVRTTSTFWLIDDENCNVYIRDYGHIALYMATAIEAASDVLLLDQNRVPLYKFETGNKYQIVFYNECHRCPDPIPNHCDERKRNDFHFNRKVVKVPSGRLKYGLKVKVPCPEADCAEPNFCLRRPHRFTDQAPCSGAGYGKAPGFP